MPPTNQESVEAAPTTPAEVKTPESVFAPLHKVTPLSKILAAVIFIALPFVGFYIGYTLAKDKYFSEDDLAKEWNLPQETEYTPDELARFNQMKLDFDNQLKLEKIKGEAESYVSTIDSTDRYWDIPTNVIDHGWLVYQPVLDAKYLISDQVAYLDANAQEVAAKPYLNYVTSFDSNIILTAGCFRFTECLYSGLYIYDKEKHTLKTMKTGSYYEEMATDSALSPDGTKLALSPLLDMGKNGTEFGYIDLVTDSYHSLETLPVSGTARFTMCEMGCWIDAKWLSQNELSATVFEFGTCDEYGQCLSTYKDDFGEEYKTTNPVATTTKTWNI